MRNAIIGHFDTKRSIIGQERHYFDPLLAILSPFLCVQNVQIFCTDFVLEKRVYFCTEFPHAYLKNSADRAFMVHFISEISLVHSLHVSGWPQSKNPSRKG